MTPEEIGLPPQVVESIRQVLGRFPDIEQVVFYGSRARGNFRPDSDIDLPLKGGLSHRDLLNIELALDDLLLSWKISLSLYSQIDNPALVEHIGRAGKVFYEWD
ncbi:nucleotidyltransferase domain-containing protein [Azotobacter chroococcum]|uniref:nucleotidyltransferase domain-containing protein n=1 Tax=Azotobacter chroococcum TaxID=353 RepID=UPI0010AE1185|nr:nucleotidyltransferase domain-containing protein [Azotobacter chroococcum]TKD43850.1 nucleotidyltransferase domain-containing protein [Azotobacter chroococcum]